MLWWCGFENATLYRAVQFLLSFLIFFGADADVQVLFSGLSLNGCYFFICNRFVSALYINTAEKINAQS